jgi:glycosyltransferase involved in cell wall biosynthesis
VSPGGHVVLIAHPSTDLYGSDRMLLRSATALRDAGARVVVTLPAGGPLVEALVAARLEVVIVPVPILRKELLRPIGLLALALRAVLSLPGQLRLLHSTGADVVYVNTITIPTWLLAGRLVGKRVVCHVREAENAVHPAIRSLLLMPLVLCSRILCNSGATAEFVGSWPGRRAAPNPEIIYNGLPLPAALPLTNQEPGHLVLVGRLSPRKGQDVAIAALAELRRRQVPATLELAGDVFPGYEWFEQELTHLVASHGLEPMVTFSGFLIDPTVAYARASVVLVPSRVEPFGNVAAEALGAGRPVVASSVQGLREVLMDGGGVLVPAEDPIALADAVQELLEMDSSAVAALCLSGREQVVRRFGEARYARDLAAIVLEQT